MEDTLQNFNDQVLKKSKQLGEGLPRPDRDVLSLMKVRERMIQIKRYLEIEAVEKQIRQKQEQIKLKQDQKKKQDHAIILARLKQKHDAQLVQLKDEK